MSDLFIFAGEMSGDLLGEKLLESLFSITPDLQVEGVGGPKMRSLGMKTFVKMEEFEVMGFVDVFFSLPKLFKLFRKIKKHLLKNPPKTIVFIDYPGFNLRMAKALKRKKISSKMIQYVCPSVWAYGKSRINTMEKTLDTLLTILPFEPILFDEKALKVSYVGHPLTQKISDYTYNPNWRNIYKIPTKAPIISIFPGSRKKELLANFPMQINCLEKVFKEKKEFVFAVSASKKEFVPFLKKHLKKNVFIIDSEHSYELMRDSHLSLATSGTVTLELALHSVPTIVCFAIKFLDVLIARTLLRINIPYFSLPNIIGEKEVFPELYGPNFTEEHLEGKLQDFLLSYVKHQNCHEACETIKNLLGNQNASLLAARSILEEHSYSAATTSFSISFPNTSSDVS